LPHFVERSADTCHAALAKMTSAVGVPGPAPFTKSLPARVGKLKPSKADHRAKRIVSRWPSRTRSLIARGPPAGSSISAEAWRSWHRFGFIACPASKRRQFATAQPGPLGVAGEGPVIVDTHTHQTWGIGPGWDPLPASVPIPGAYDWDRGDQGFAYQPQRPPRREKSTRRPPKWRGARKRMGGMIPRIRLSADCD
jgi:hypothetical protein